VARKTDHAKREQLARKAFAVNCENGAHRTTMSEIANVLGIKRPTLYWYFKDLDDIVAAMVPIAYREMALHLVQELNDIAHPLDFLEQLLFCVVDYFGGKEEEVLMLFQLWASQPAGRRQTILTSGRELLDPLRETMRHLLEQGIARGQVRECDVGALIDLITATIDGTLLASIAHDFDSERTLRFFVQCVLDPLRLQEQEQARERERTGEQLRPQEISANEESL